MCFGRGGVPFDESNPLSRCLPSPCLCIPTPQGAADVMATRADTDRQRAALGRAGVVFDRDYAATAHM